MPKKFDTKEQRIIDSIPDAFEDRLVASKLPKELTEDTCPATKEHVQNADFILPFTDMLAEKLAQTISNYTKYVDAIPELKEIIYNHNKSISKRKPKEPVSPKHYVRSFIMKSHFPIEVRGSYLRIKRIADYKKHKTIKTINKKDEPCTKDEVRAILSNIIRTSGNTRTENKLKMDAISLLGKIEGWEKTPQIPVQPLIMNWNMPAVMQPEEKQAIPINVVQDKDSTEITEMNLKNVTTDFVQVDP